MRGLPGLHQFFQALPHLGQGLGGGVGVGVGVVGGSAHGARLLVLQLGTPLLGGGAGGQPGLLQRFAGGVQLGL